MIKKLLKLTKFVITGVIWSILYIGFANLLTQIIWSFDLFTFPQSWRIINAYWQSGKVISGLDLLFFLTLFLLFIGWLWGLFYFYRLNYFKILFSPIILYNHLVERKYGKDSPRIILRNLGTSTQKPDINIIIEEKLAAETKELEQQKIDIRSTIKEKIESSQQ